MKLVYGKPRVEKIQGRRIRFTLFENDYDGPNDLCIRVDDPKDKEKVICAIGEALEKKYWRYSFTDQKLKEKFKIDIGEDKEVELYSFMSRPTLVKELWTIASTLSKYYYSLTDKKNWQIESIQLSSKNANGCILGCPVRSVSFPAQKRFLLYPAAFDEKSEWEKISSLKQTTAHEPTHLCIAKSLRECWERNMKRLGWEKLNNILLRLPDGGKTRWFNCKPDECPSRLGSISPEEDLAYSVAAILVHPKVLNSRREKILSEHFSPVVPPTKPRIYDVFPDFPDIPELKIHVKTGSGVKYEQPPAVKLEILEVELDDYRKERGIPVFQTA